MADVRQDGSAVWEGFAQNARLGRGVNVIGYDPIWGSRSEGRMQDRHFRLIKEAGFDSVRINLHPFEFMGSPPEYAIVDSWMDTLDWAVDCALAHNLMVILDMHEFHAMGDDPVGSKPKFLATWRQLASHCQDLPSVVIFELLNEPCRELTPDLWNKFLKEAYTIVRENNPHRTLTIGPASYNSIDHLAQLELPQDDKNIIVTVHYYRPGEFTHQGAHWSSHKDVVGVEWLGTVEEKRAIIEDFLKAQAWAEEHEYPLFLGEFGAYDKADTASRVRWTSFVARQAEALDWSWAYWQFDSDFIVYDIDDDHWIEPIRDALLPQS